MTNEANPTYDVVIVGGGPAGLSAALALGRGRKRVLLADGGPRRNAAAKNVHNFVTRDGTPPQDFRNTALAQLKIYPNVEARDEPVLSIAGSRGAFVATLPSGEVTSRRIMLCTGLIDEMLPIDGFRELWGRSIFQCPYCHGWEVQDRRWAYLARDVESLGFAVKLRGWTRDMIAFTNDAFAVPDAQRAKLSSAGVQVETRSIRRLVARDGHLASIELDGGTSVACDVLFTHPPQHQVDVVRALGVALEPDGLVRIDPTTRETSVPGIYAGGDLTSRMQGAIFAAAAGTNAAAQLNAELTAELASQGVL